MPSSPLQPSQACLSMIERFEGFSATPYFDVNGYAIGYGSHYINGVRVMADTPTITQIEAATAMQITANDLATQILKLVTTTLTQGQLDGLTDFCYNLGIGNFEQSSILKHINSNMPVPEELFTEWDLVNGVPNDTILDRRKAEYNLYETM